MQPLNSMQPRAYVRIRSLSDRGAAAQKRKEEKEKNKQKGQEPQEDGEQEEEDERTEATHEEEWPVDDEDVQEPPAKRTR